MESETVIDEDEEWEQTDGANNEVTEENEHQLRIVLLGKTGDGKSATGNTLLGREEFVSTVSAESVTTFCRLGSVDRFGKRIRVVDTPGFFDTRMSNDKIRKEIVKCVAMCSPGPHAFVIVIRPDRFTKEVRDTMKLIKDTFGREVMRYMVILFTRKDDLEFAEKTIEDFVKESPQPLKFIIQEVENQFTAINNRCSKGDREKEAMVFVEMIEKIVERNNGKYYTHELFLQAEKELKDEELRRRKEIEDEKRQAMDAIRKELMDEGDEREEQYRERILELEKNMEGRLERVREDVINDVQEERGDGLEIIGRLISNLLQGVVRSMERCSVM